MGKGEMSAIIIQAKNEGQEKIPLVQRNNTGEKRAQVKNRKNNSYTLTIDNVMSKN